MSVTSKKETFRIPRSIKIKGRTYKIIQKNKIEYEGKLCYGLHCGDEGKIYIMKGLDVDLKRITFLHEVFHAYCHECNIREGLDAQLEEVITETLAQCVNKHFQIRWR